MQKTESLAPPGEILPICPDRFQERERSVDIRANEIVRPQDRPIDVAFGGEMHYGARLAAIQKAAYQFSVADVALYKFVSAIIRNGGKILQVPRVGKFIQINQGRNRSRSIQRKMKLDPIKPAPPVIKTVSFMFRLGYQPISNFHCN